TATDLRLSRLLCSVWAVPILAYQERDEPAGYEQRLTTHKGKNMARSAPNRWGQLIAAIICQGMIANLQYGWTLFVRPMNQAHGWAIAEIQIAFSIFIALETWLTPLEGWLADKIGPKLVVAVGGVMVAVGWIINAYADSLAMLYLG